MSPRYVPQLLIQKIVHNSTTNEAREKIGTEFDWPILEIF
jgi:hypothetical protein